MEIQIRALRAIPAATAGEEDIAAGEVVLRGAVGEGVGENTLREMLRGPWYAVEVADAD